MSFARQRTEHVVTFDGRRVRVSLRDASGPTVVLLHAIGLDRHMWDAVTDALPLDVRVVAPDLWAEDPADAPSLQVQVRRVTDLLERDSRPAHLVGLSYGGVVAQLVALARPDLVATLGLVATIAEAPAGTFEARADAAAAAMDTEIIRTIVRWFGSRQVAAGGPAVSYARACLEAVSAERWATGWRQLAGCHLLDALETITVPSYVVAGELDSSAPPLAMSEMARRLGAGPVDVLDGAFHLLALERPTELAAIIGRALAQAEAWAR